MEYLIGVDLGTQGTKASLRDAAGVEAASAFEPSRLIYPEVGAVEQDPEEMFGSVVTTMSEVMARSGVRPGDVAGIALSGQMAGIMGIGADGMAVTPYDSWLDTRSGTYRQRFLDYGEDAIIALTGAPVTYAHGPKILSWKYARPDVYARIRKFVQPAAYVAMRLTGMAADDAFIDHTYLHFAGFADTEKRRWSGDLLSALDVDATRMPRIVRPYDRIGGLTDAMAAACGVRSGTPVVAGLGDTAASIHGAGVTRPGLFLDVAGTASVLACAADAFVPDVRHKTIMFSNAVTDGLFVPYAYINGGGMCLKWFRDDILGGGRDYDDLNALAATVPAGSDGLLFLPHFSGRVCPNDTLVRGSYQNLTWKHGAAHLYRAILEGIAYEYGVYTDIIRELLPELQFRQVFSVGGGSRGELFRQIKADVLDIPVSTINLADTSLLACCAVAGFGVGLYETPTSLVDENLRVRDTLQPDADRHRRYRRMQDVYADVFASQHDIIRRLQAVNGAGGE